MTDPAHGATLGAALRLERPGCIEFGLGQAAAVGQWASANGVTQTLVLCDAFNAPRVDRLALRGTVSIHVAPAGEPDIAAIDTAVEAMRSAAPQLIVGFGGGSVMDSAKLVSVLAPAACTIDEIAGADKAPKRQTLLVQVPTTAGTGSEVGPRALVTNPDTGQKIAVESAHMLADLAVVDPALTASLPAEITAATGIDALAHCVEAFTSRRAHPLIDMYAERGIALVGTFLGRAVRDGDDLEARAGLSLASCFGGYCLGPVNTTAGHAVSYPLGTRHKIAHGLANAVIFPHTLAFNARAVPDKTRRIAVSLGFANDDVFAGAYRFCTELGIEMRLRRLGVPESDLVTMATEAHRIRRLLDHNPRDMSVDDIVTIYREAL